MEYLRHLAEKDLLKQPAFIHYLDYLQSRLPRPVLCFLWSLTPWVGWTIQLLGGTQSLDGFCDSGFFIIGRMLRPLIMGRSGLSTVFNIVGMSPDYPASTPCIIPSPVFPPNPGHSQFRVKPASVLEAT